MLSKILLLNQLTKEEFDQNNYTEFEWDCRALTKHWRTIGGTPQSAFEKTYDKLHRVLKEKYASEEEMEYQVDNKGRIVSIADPTYGQDVSDPQPTPYNYNQKGQLIGISRDKTVSPEENESKQGFDYQYDINGRLTQAVFPDTKGYVNKTKVAYEYHDDDSIKSIRVWDTTSGQSEDYKEEEIYNLSYNYNRNGWVSQKVIRDNIADANPRYRISYEYDERGQLSRELYEKWDSNDKVMTVLKDVTYEYDLAGNITKKSYSDGTTLTYTYSIGYQMTQVTDGSARRLSGTTSQMPTRVTG